MELLTEHKGVWFRIRFGRAILNFLLRDQYRVPILVKENSTFSPGHFPNTPLSSYQSATATFCRLVLLAILGPTAQPSGKLEVISTTWGPDVGMDEKFSSPSEYARLLDRIPKMGN